MPELPELFELLLFELLPELPELPELFELPELPELFEFEPLLPEFELSEFESSLLSESDESFLFELFGFVDWFVPESALPLPVSFFGSSTFSGPTAMIWSTAAFVVVSLASVSLSATPST